MIKELTIQEKTQNKFVQLVKSEDYPLEVREGINEVLKIINEEKSITDIYPEILAEIPISQSQFQDQCVQYEQHFTSHKKLRQAVMEMQDRLNALYAAKTGNKKALIEVERINLKLQELNSNLENLKNKYSKNPGISEVEDIAMQNLKLDILEKMVELEESERDLKSSSHLIKDAMLKVVHQQKLIDRYTKEVEESGLSFEEAEVEYYVAYFTSEAEKQLRSGDHQVDRGTFGAIGQLPESIRLKVLSNISFLKQKIFSEGFHPESDYLYKTHWDILKPKKTGENEFEGMKIKDFLGVETINLLTNNVDSNTQ